MKKLLYILFLFCALFIGAYKTNHVSKISRGAKVIGRCCKELSAGDRKSGGVLKAESETAEPNHNVSSILPAYFWDTKSMIR